MKAVVQRVISASVEVSGQTVGAIGAGLLVFVGAEEGDGPDDAGALVTKVAGLRIFADEDGKMNRSVVDTGGEVLVVSQFTLAAEIAKGRRPSFTRAAEPTLARELLGRVVTGFRGSGLVVAEGRFGAQMEVALINDGPVTIIAATSGGKVA